MVFSYFGFRIIGNRFRVTSFFSTRCRLYPTGWVVRIHRYRVVVGTSPYFLSNSLPFIFRPCVYVKIIIADAENQDTPNLAFK